MTRPPRMNPTAEILSRIADGFVSWDRDWRYTYVNERAAAMFGVQPEDLLGRTYYEAFPDAVGTPFEQAYVKAMRDQVPIQLEARYAPWDRWFENRIYPSDGGLAIFFAEITDRKLAEVALRESEARFVRAQAVAHIGSWELDLRTGTIWASEEAFKIYGVDRLTPQLPLARVQELVVAADRPRLDAALASLLEGDVAYDLEFRVRRAADGAVRVIHSLAEAVRDPSGAAVGVVGTIQDVTARVAAEEERTRLVSAIDQATDIVMLQAPDGTLTYANPAFCRVYGYTSDQAVGHTPHFLSSGRHPISFWEGREAALHDGRTWSGRIVNRTQAGSLVEVDTTTSPVRGDDGLLRGYVQVARDVTLQRALEARLAESRRMESIGQLAGGIAHDFNNMLTAIRGYAEMLRTGTPGRHGDDRADIDQVIRAADRAADLTRQLLAYSRHMVLEPRVVDVAEVVQDITPLLRRMIGEHITIDLRFTSPEGRVRVDPTQLEQVIVNLAVNARDAMPDGGRLTIETATIDVDGSPPPDQPEIAPGRYVRLSVEDSGIGMDEETAARIFEPFFTTKEPGRGTGMGLATVHGVVTQSGGVIGVTSRPGRGTAFTIYLPRVDEPATSPTPEPEVRAAEGSETVLLVEDDDAVRELARRVLERHGYSVIVAADGLQALALGADESTRIDVLVTDVAMPGLTGPVVAERLLEARPLLRVLFVSGFSESSDPHLLRGTRSVFLPKPYTADALTAAVRTTLDDDPPGASVGPGAAGATGATGATGA